MKRSQEIFNLANEVSNNQSIVPEDQALAYSIIVGRATVFLEELETELETIKQRERHSFQNQ